MPTTVYNCETVTPMFLAGADGQTPELRPPSIKGALRFWWRALHGHSNNLREAESQIFGDTTRRSKVVVRTSFDSIKLEEKSRKNTKFHSVSDHTLNWLSYGTWPIGDNAARGYVEEEFQFDIKLKFSSSLDEDQKKEVIKAFKAFAAFGNLGMKMRNGFGSFQVTKEQIDAKKLFDEIKSGTKEGMPIFHAFSKKAEFFQTRQSYSSWRDVLTKMGEMYKENKKVRWDEYDPRHAKSYFLKVNKSGDKYTGQILVLPCSSPKKEDRNKVETFKNVLSNSNLFI